MENKKLLQIKKIHKLFRDYRGKMKNIWEEYYYLQYTINKIKTNEFKLIGVYSDFKTNKRKKDAGGMQARFLNGNNAKTHYIDSISQYEKFIVNLMTIVYFNYPRKMESAGMNDKKLFNIILDNVTKEDAINRIIEEKLRGIFYGNPLDIYLKDKLKIGISKNDIDRYKNYIIFFKEIISIRNIIIHNDSRVDSKFLIEIGGNKYKLNQFIVINENYLRGTIGLLIGLAALLTNSVITNIYKSSCQGKLQQSINSLDNAIKNNWFEKLLII